MHASPARHTDHTTVPPGRGGEYNVETGWLSAEDLFDAGQTRRKTAPLAARQYACGPVGNAAPPEGHPWVRQSGRKRLSTGKAGAGLPGASSKGANSRKARW